MSKMCPVHNVELAGFDRVLWCNICEGQEQESKEHLTDVSSYSGTYLGRVKSVRNANRDTLPEVDFEIVFPTDSISYITKEFVIDLGTTSTSDPEGYDEG